MGERHPALAVNTSLKTRDQLYEPVGRTNTEPCVADTSPEETAEPAAVEADSVSTAEEMALSSRPPGEVDSKKYVSVVSSDTFSSFQQNGYHEEEDIDFTPQNGYVEPEEMDTQEAKGTAKEKKKARSDLEDGYEPVGKPPGVIEAVISQQGVYRVGEDTAIRNIEDGGGHMGVKNRIEIEKIIHKETMMEDFENYNDHLSDENVVHLQRDFQSDENSKLAENIKDETVSKKEMKKQKAEKEKLLKEEKKR